MTAIAAGVTATIVLSLIATGMSEAGLAGTGYGQAIGKTNACAVAKQQAQMQMMHHRSAEVGRRTNVEVREEIGGCECAETATSKKLGTDGWECVSTWSLHIGSQSPR